MSRYLMILTKEYGAEFEKCPEGSVIQSEVGYDGDHESITVLAVEAEDETRALQSYYAWLARTGDELVLVGLYLAESKSPPLDLKQQIAKHRAERLAREREERMRASVRHEHQQLEQLMAKYPDVVEAKKKS